MAKLKASSTCRRPIHITYGKETYTIVPGGKASAFVTVPDEVLNLPFVESRIDDGELVVGRSSAEDKTEQSELEELRQKCKDLGIRYNGKHKAETLRELIEMKEGDDE